MEWSERERERGVCLAKQGQPLVRCPSFIDKGPGKYVGGERGKKKKTNEIINVVELMMNGNKKRLGSLWSRGEALLH